MHNDEMTDATKLAPCPLCGDLMKVTNAGTFGHTDSNAECLLAKYAWGDEPQFVTAWNQRALTAVAQGEGEMERFCETCGKPNNTSSATATNCPACEQWWKDNPPTPSPEAGLADDLSDKVAGAIQWLEQMADRFEYEWPNTAQHCRLHVDILRTALRTPTPADRAEKAEALLREARKNIGPLVRFHETGGHEGGGSDGALDHAVATLTAIDAHLAGEPGQGA